MSKEVEAFPSKAFFVSMLTRDIDLRDAILDLLDNCIDGVLRRLSENEINSDKPYKGYWARITANRDEFIIKDNCGGIPKDIAKLSAFRLGRPDLERDRDLPTVGMYGIGMKRALFKMGKHSLVISQHEGDVYTVEIPPKWLDNDDDWMLDINDEDDRFDDDGTEIIINDLYPSISSQFNKDERTFLEDLRNDISFFFALIIGKGFQVYLNDNEIIPVPLGLLSPKDFDTSKIKPYLYKARLEDVEINLSVGFYRELASEAEIEDENKIPRRSDNAGWTIICNDRVVLHRDKSKKTGWGLSPVPQYHTQFIAIAGAVIFKSENSLNLPVNTTKRGLDTSSEIYFHVLDQMKFGMKKFTDFTNHWKGREEETTKWFEQMETVDPQVLNEMPEVKWVTVPRTNGTELRNNVDLPRPPQTNRKRRISFLREQQEVELAGNYLFDDPKADTSAIGHRCFDIVLEKIEEEI